MAPPPSMPAEQVMARPRKPGLRPRVSIPARFEDLFRRLAEQEGLSLPDQALRYVEAGLIRDLMALVAERRGLSLHALASEYIEAALVEEHASERRGPGAARA